MFNFHQNLENEERISFYINSFLKENSLSKTRLHIKDPKKKDNSVSNLSISEVRNIELIEVDKSNKDKIQNIEEDNNKNNYNKIKMIKKFNEEVDNKDTKFSNTNNRQENPNKFEKQYTDQDQIEIKENADVLSKNSSRKILKKNIYNENGDNNQNDENIVYNSKALQRIIDRKEKMSLGFSDLFKYC